LRKYLLAQILPLANLASAQNPANIPVLTAALEDLNPVIRYWGALGLRALGAVKQCVGFRAKPDEPVLDSTNTAHYGRMHR
jgi:hypothetical protein